MQRSLRKWWVRTGLALRQNRGALVFVGAWIVAGAAVLHHQLGLAPLAALAVATCVTKAPGGLPGLYQSFTEVVVFGLVASVVVTNVTKRYRPEETCRALAARSTDHVVVIGYTNLGRRIADMVTAAGQPLVVVEEDATQVAERIRAELPLVVGSAQQREVVAAAGVARAKVVVIATDDLETAAVASRLVRELNAGCELVVRCPDEDVGAVLGKTYRARVVSTSRLAAGFIQSFAVKHRSRAVVVLGTSELGRKTVEALEEKRIACTLAAVTEDPAALLDAGVAAADLIVICDDDLGRNLVRVDRIRDANKRARIVCRAFHEEAAELLARAPFDCLVFSTSKHAAEALARAGALREVGITDVPERVARGLAGVAASVGAA